jgi:hypothetical protein
MRLTNCQILPGIYFEIWVKLYILKHFQKGRSMETYLSESSIEKDKSSFPVKRTINDSAKFDAGNDIRISPALLRFLYKYNQTKVMIKTSHIHLRMLKYLVNRFSFL